MALALAALQARGLPLTTMKRGADWFLTAGSHLNASECCAIYAATHHA